MIINPYLVQPSGPSYGTLTTAWIAATGETDLTILGALNTLETDLTTYGLTAKMDALYPFVGGTAGKHSYNFMNTAQYQLSFSGGWTHSSTGALSNGTNAFGNTNLSPNSVLLKDSNSHSAYIRNLPSQTIAYQGVGTPNWFISGKAFAAVEYFANASSAITATNDLKGLCAYTRRSSSDIEMYKNGVSISTGTTSSLNLPSNNFYLGAVNDNGTASYYIGSEYAFFHLGDGLTDTESANFYTAVQTFQTTLGRQVGVPIVSDADAQAFLNAAVITDTTQASAVNTLVTGLKADGLWTKMAAIYPFVGGSATAHSYNLKNTAAYQLTFNGGWTHSSTGALPNGTNAYADTSFNVNTYKDNNHLSYYIRTNLDEVRVDAGLIGSIGQYFDIESRISNVGYFGNHIAAVNVNFAVTDSRGLWLNTRTTSTLQKVYKNGTSQGSNTASGTTAINGNVYLGARNLVGTGANLYSTKQTAFASIGDGLDDTEAANLYTRVQTYQTALSRNV